LPLMACAPRSTSSGLELADSLSFLPSSDDTVRPLAPSQAARPSMAGLYVVDSQLPSSIHLFAQCYCSSFLILFGVRSTSVSRAWGNDIPTFFRCSLVFVRALYGYNQQFFPPS
jgi:hypothetical protein